MRAQLLCRLRTGVTQAFTLRGEESVLGREPGTAVPVPVEGVSRRHARVLWDGKSYWLEDLKSTNGTFLNGIAVTRERLRNLDVVTLGRKVDLVFVVREEAAAPLKRPGIVRAALVPLEGDPTPAEVPVGEITLGRAPVNNLVADSGAVSKIHARIERTMDQLILQDLESSHGTFVNDERVTTTRLRDGDVVSLARVFSYRVQIEQGEIVGGSGAYRAAAATAVPPKAEARPHLSNEWKTRLEWESGEIRQIDQFRYPVADPGTETPLDGVEAYKGPARRKPAAAPVAKPVGPVKPSTAPPAAPVREIRLVGRGVTLTVVTPGAHDIGRSRDVPLRVNDATVSRRHARVILADDRRGAYIEHAGGANGTRLNGKTVTDRQPLADGDTIGVGEAELKVSLVRE